MFKKTMLFTLLMALFEPWALNAQTTETIRDFNCPEPTGVAVSNLTDHSVTIGWDAEEGATYQYGLQDMNQYDPNVPFEFNSQTEVNSESWSNLDSATQYIFCLRKDCGTDGYSETVSITFTTEEACPDGKVCIGYGTSNCQYIPTRTYNSYSLTQQIYTVAELGEAGLLESIDFYNSASQRTRTLDIYMVSTDKDSFTSSTDWVSVTAADLVFSGSVTFVQNDWTTITFDESFIYDGEHNVVLVVDDNTNSLSYGPRFRAFNVEQTQAICKFDDYTNPDPTGNPGTANRTQARKNRVRFQKSEQQTTVTQTIALSSGWNWISSDVEITLDDLEAALMNALPGANSITIKSQTQSVTYNGISWRGTLDEIDCAQMYEIKTTASCTITLTGLPINPLEHSVTIHKGHNWIAFPLSESMSPTDAFDGFAVNGDMVTSQFSSATYNNGNWRGTLNVLAPGQGYIYKSNVQGDRTFTFPAGTRKR